MSEYQLKWITDCLAVGPAPMSYEDLDYIRSLGISGVVNLCAEFSDLHELEEQAGFEVCYLPIFDETAPTIEEMEKGLEWLDEAVYLDKKILVHCHHGVGRTGTFVTAYMLRRGFNLKNAEKVLRKTRANPTNSSQWWLLKKFGRKEGQLKMEDPSVDNRSRADFSEIYAKYEDLLRQLDSQISGKGDKCCADSCPRVNKSTPLSPIEAMYLNNKVNVVLTSEQRAKVIHNASDDLSCPLYRDETCLLHKYRPIHCRIRSGDGDSLDLQEINKELTLLSQQIFKALLGEDTRIDSSLPEVSSREAISGKFIQRYFHFLTSQASSNGTDHKPKK